MSQFGFQIFGICQLAVEPPELPDFVTQTVVIGKLRLQRSKF